MGDEVIRVCIVGGGFGGLYTALYLSNWHWVKSGKCQVTLVEPKDNFLFSPLLYEILTGELQAWEIAPSYQKLLAGTGVNFCQDRVEGVDLVNRQVKLEAGESLAYDYLVLGVGRKTRLATIPGLESYALTFRSLADAERLEAQLQVMESSERKHLRVAVIGAGANGVELACKVSDRLGNKAQVSLIESGDKILKYFGSGVQKAAKKAIKARNIQVYLRTSVKEIEADRITLVSSNQIMTHSVDLVLWTTGTETIDWVYDLGCQQTSQGKLLTRSTLQLIDYPEVFAVGDIAEIRESKTKIVPATAQAAYQQASFLAKNLQLALEGKNLKYFRYLHLGDMLTLGKGAAVVSSFGINLEGSLAGIIRRLIYVQRLPTLRHRWQVLKNLLFGKKM
jgi:NADH dehydrogenase